MQKNEPLKLTEIYTHYFGDIPNTRSYILLDIGARDSSGDDAILPLVEYKFR